MIRNYHHPLLLLVLLCLHYLLYASKCAGSGVVECLPHDRSSLLDLKHGFDYLNGSTLGSWIPGSNCCNWVGVTCDPESGHIIGLDLSGSHLSGNLSSSLFNLTSLQTLNLAYTEFRPLPQSGFEKLTKLTHLNLSGVYIGNPSGPYSSRGYYSRAYTVHRIPVGSISRLTNLISLDLTSYDIRWYYSYPSSPLYIPNEELSVSDLQTLVGNISNLKELHLDGINMSSVLNWSRILSTSLPRLQVLTLQDCQLSGEITKELFELKSLRVLDSSWNEELSGTLPEFPKDSVLRSLDLSVTNISGHLPDSIGNLKYMEYLDISSGLLSGVLPSSIWNLTRLVHLDLSFNNFFRDTIPSSVNLACLGYLDLSYNFLRGTVPSSLNLTRLVHLDLSANFFRGTIPSFLNLTRLAHLDISSNFFRGTIPSSMNLTRLAYLDISSNFFRGAVPYSIGNLTRLVHLDISHNNFSSVIPTSMGSLAQLDYVDLSWNSFDGPVPSLVPWTRVTELHLHDNDLTGPIPESLFFLSSLKILDLSNNRFSGQLEEFLNPSISLSHIDLHNNRLWGQIPRSFFMLPSLTSLSLQSNCFSGSLVLDSIEMSENLTQLDLSNNRLQGQIPLPPPFIETLDYSNNNFSSFIPSKFFIHINHTNFISLANNSLEGEISHCFCNVAPLVLDLSDNFLSSSIPSCLLQVPHQVLNLGRNRLRGTIPHNISEANSIILNDNQLEGHLPRSLANCTGLQVLDVGNNLLVDSFPFWLGNQVNLQVLSLTANRFYGPVDLPNRQDANFPGLQILDLSSNHFHGNLPIKFLGCLKVMMNKSQPGDSPLQQEYSGHKHSLYENTVLIISKGQDFTLEMTLKIFYIVLDFSNNRFEGDIPSVIGELKGLHVLNLSRNSLTGNIPGAIGDLRQLQALDLSSNHLSGEIPQQLTSLTFLESLNLSSNNLVGRIPQANQFSTFSNTSYLDNQGLCGSPLSKECGGIAGPNGTDTTPPAHSDHSSTYEIGMALSIGLGFGFGIAVVIVVQNVSWNFLKRKNAAST